MQYYLRVAELEVPERETEELLAELVPAMEAQGHDAGAVRRLAAGEGLAVSVVDLSLPAHFGGA